MKNTTLLTDNLYIPPKICTCFNFRSIAESLMSLKANAVGSDMLWTHERCSGDLKALENISISKDSHMVKAFENQPLRWHKRADTE